MRKAVEAAVSRVTAEKHWLVVRWRDLYLRVMKPSKGPGGAGIAPNRRGPSFFCLRRVERPPRWWRQLITCLVLTMSTGSVLVTPAPSPADQLRGGRPPLPGGNITPGNNTDYTNCTLDIMTMPTKVILATPPSICS